ncbi:MULTISPECIES: hypothetical protein [Emticicia]|uniref:hypothetical protein n=1 Tax=Emticicia TaxID=312278 RepID=UPI0007D8C668|nr:MULTISPECIES: hypothetical protein [Emticicia]
MKTSTVLMVWALLLCSAKSFAQKPDTLYAKKGFWKTAIYKDSNKLTSKEVLVLYGDTWAPKVKYKWSNIIRPTGGVAMVGGIGLIAVGVKGLDVITVVEGKQTKYTLRSLPQMAAGAGLLVLGFNMVLSSNLLVKNSVDVYNHMINSSKKMSYIDRVQLGITNNNSIGVIVSLK